MRMDRASGLYSCLLQQSPDIRSVLHWALHSVLKNGSLFQNLPSISTCIQKDAEKGSSAVMWYRMDEALCQAAPWLLSQLCSLAPPCLHGLSGILSAARPVLMSSFHDFHIAFGCNQPNGPKVTGRRVKQLKMFAMVGSFQQESTLVSLQFSPSKKIQLKETKNAQKKLLYDLKYFNPINI